MPWRSRQVRRRQRRTGREPRLVTDRYADAAVVADGSLDKDIPRALHALMGERAGGKEVIEVKGASHVVMISPIPTRYRP